MNRFQRQMSLPEIGPEGQRKLSDAKVLVVGAGGLGCPILQYLAAAGVGTLGIVDGDTVSESNLNRQILFGQRDIGKPKATAAGVLLKDKYPDIRFLVYPEFLGNTNTLEIFEAYDLIIDGTDNFGTRYLINDACVLLHKPFIMGAIFKYEGQVSVFNFGKDAVNYRDLYPIPPKQHEVPNCSETGVLGTLPGLIGMLQATEAIKVITGVGKVLLGIMLHYNLKTAEFFQVEIPHNPKSKEVTPATVEEFLVRNYDIQCGLPNRITWQEVIEYMGTHGRMLVDIREPGEEPVFFMKSVARIQRKELQKNPVALEAAEVIYLFCKTGGRSDKLALLLQNLYPEKQIFSVEGGILDPTSPIFINYESKAQKYIH